MTRGAWAVHRARGAASELHAASALLVGAEAVGRAARVLEADRPAVVLGSAEPDGHVDAARAERRGVEVARRQSGGSAVLVGPGEVLWVDLVVPRGDPLWDDDVGRAAWWVGEAWAGALADAGAGPATVWRGALRRHPWSARVCFAGVGPGEVLGPGAGPKLVGVSQRRTRAGALFQCAALLRWRPGDLLDVLALDGRRRERGAEELAGVAAGVGGDAAPALLDALLCRLPA